MRIKKQFNQVISGLKKVPGFSLAVIFTLAVTLGALLAAFNLNQVVLFKPLPYPEANNLYLLQQNLINDGKDTIGGQSDAGLITMYKKSKALGQQSSIFLQRRGQVSSDPKRPVVIANFVTPEYHQLLGAKHVLGEGLSQVSWFQDAPNEVVLSYHYWQENFAGSDSAIGQSIGFEGKDYRIVGVLSRQFYDPEPLSVYGPGELIFPMAVQGLRDNVWTNGLRNLQSIQKIDDAVEYQQMVNELSSSLQTGVSNSEAAEGFQQYTLKAHLTPLSEAIRGDSEKITLLVLAGAIMLLLIAFANIANLYISHVVKQQSLLAICASLGAKPKHIFQRLFIESAVLTFVATVIGLLLSAWLLEFTKSLAQGSITRLHELGVDVTTGLVACLLAVLLSVILALIGKKVINYEKLKEQLTSSGKGTQKQVSSKVRTGLIISQVTLTGIMLFASSAVLQSSLELAYKPLGLNAKNLLSANINPGEKYATPDSRRAIIEKVKQHFAALPQVEKVAKSLISPIRKGDFSTPVVNQANQQLGHFGFNGIDADYLNLVGIPILYGRNLTKAEVTDSANVLLISQTAAKLAFGKENAVGERLGFAATEQREIVGIVADHFNAYAHKLYQGELYFPLATMRLNLMIKLKSGQTMSRAQVAKEIEQVDPTLALLEFLDVEQTGKDLVFHYRLAAWLSAGLTLLALILACTGIYGVVSYATEMRRYELGVRMAMGARPKRITRLVVNQALKPLIVGIILSMLLTIGLYFVFSNKLVAFASPNLIQVLLALGLLLGFCYLACMIPVKKVIESDPISALRNE